MDPTPGQELRNKYRKTGILTLPPEQGGITELVCDMDECYHPLGRGHFEPIPDPMPNPIPEWIPTEDHFPRSQETGGRRTPGNVRLAHRRCNGDDFGIGPGHDKKRKKARQEKQQWLDEHREEVAANEAEYADAERRWKASRSETIVPELDQLTSRAMTFDGALLERGFWLYVWRIDWSSTSVVYVGRTGDSSSPNASSPFRRAGQHLEIAANARGNSMNRKLQAEGIDPTTCTFRLVAVGPIFPEQPDMALHVPVRDQMAAQETALAGLLRSRGYTVIGQHPASRIYDRGLFERVRELIDSKFP